MRILLAAPALILLGLAVRAVVGAQTLPEGCIATGPDGRFLCWQAAAPPPTLPPAATATAAPAPTSTPVIPPTNFSFTLGPEQAMYVELSLIHIPDAHISHVWQGNEMRQFISAGVSGYRFTGPNADSLTLNPTTPVIKPGPLPNEYKAFGSVIPGPNGELFGYYHAESCGRGNYTATVGAAVSVDGGLTWSDKGNVITGYQANQSCTKSRPSGAGQPSVIRIGTFVYVYYTQWGGGYPDTIHVARANYADAVMPGAFTKWRSGNWNGIGLGGQSSSVIPSVLDTFAANASVSWNTYLQKYITVFDASKGFYLVTSKDGVTWDTPRLVFAYPKPHNQRTTGDVIFNYPSLASPDEATSETTSKTGWLYYAKGIVGGTPHEMFRAPFSLEAMP